MASTYAFAEVARLPAPGDNMAIATRKLDAGTVIEHNGECYTLSHTVLEGHRFAVEPIRTGGSLLSWGLPFGMAIRDIAPGEYACNAKILATLSTRSIDFALPTAPNFQDVLGVYELDDAAFQPGVQVAQYAEPRTFAGYRRSGRVGSAPEISSSYWALLRGRRLRQGAGRTSAAPRGRPR